MLRYANPTLLSKLLSLCVPVCIIFEPQSTVIRQSIDVDFTDFKYIPEHLPYLYVYNITLYNTKVVR